jgi:uncharacterized membrane protein YqjE
MKTNNADVFEQDLKDYFAERFDVPSRLKAQIGAELREHKKENIRWAGIMVVCSMLCFITLGLISLMLFGQAVLWVLIALGAVYYFTAIGGAVIVLISGYRRLVPNTLNLH